MSNLSDLLPAGASGKTINAVATEAIASKTPVVLNSAGTVSLIAGASVSVSGSVVFAPNDAGFMASAYDSGSNKTVIAYSDSNNSSYGTGVVATVSGSSISYGTPVVYESAGVSNQSIAYDVNANKTVISYADAGNSEYGKSVVATVSGTSISFGSPVTFNSAGTTSTTTVYDANAQKVLVSCNSTYSAGKSSVGTVSGTAISFGTQATFNGAYSALNADSSTYDSTAQKILLAYVYNSVGYAIVGTISGTTVSFGTAGTYYSGSNSAITATYDSAKNKTGIFYSRSSDDTGWAVVATVSGTSVTFGTAAQFSATQMVESSASYNVASGDICVFYRASSSSGYHGKFVTGSISGTNISVSTASTVFSASMESPASSYDSASERVVTSYRDNVSDEGEAKVVQVVPANVTSFVGIADAAISSGAAGTIVVQGGTATGANAILPLAMSFGSAAVFEPAESGDISSAFDSNSNKVVVAYRVDGAGWYGTAAVGTVSGNSISYGTPVVFESANTESCSAVFDSNANKVVIAYKDGGNSKYGTAIVGTVSATSISFGTAVLFESVRSDQIVATFDSDSNKIVIAYLDTGGSNTGEAIVGTVSNTSISFGTPVQFEPATIEYNSITFDSNSNRVIIAYSDAGNSTYGTAVVGTVSGTSISFGTPVVYNTATTRSNAVTFDGANRIIVAYRDGGNSNYGTINVASVSGNSILFGGTAAVFAASAVDDIGATVDSNLGKIVLAYRDGGNSSDGTAIFGARISSYVVDFESPVVYETGGGARFNSVIFDSNSNKLVISYGDSGNSTYGTSIVGEIGAGSFTTGSKYYVTLAGSYSTSAGSPSVNAGLAISTTALLLNGDT